MYEMHLIFVTYLTLCEIFTYINNLINLKLNLGHPHSHVT